MEPKQRYNIKGFVKGRSTSEVKGRDITSKVDQQIKVKSYDDIEERHQYIGLAMCQAAKDQKQANTRGKIEICGEQNK